MSCAVDIRVNPAPDGGNTFTSMDLVQGTVVLTLKSETSIRSIVVKLEGVAETILQEQRHLDDEFDRRGRRRRNRGSRENTVIEIHKVLYKMQTVFPPQSISNESSSNQFTLPAGTYSYNFAMRIPVNSECGKGTQDASRSNQQGVSGLANGISNSLGAGDIAKFKLSAGGLDVARAARDHFEGPLPPSLSGLPSASIKYFVKVTVNRASFFKMNARKSHPFVFLPIDPPRLIESSRTSFVRRPITVGTSVPSQQPKSRSNSFFGKILSNPSVSAMMGVNTWPGDTLSFTFDMRFPSASMFIPTEPLPIELFAFFEKDPTSLTEQKAIYLDALDVTLYAKTFMKAHSVDTTVPLKLRICQKKGLAIPLALTSCTPVTRSGRQVYEIRIPPELLDGIILPDYVCPTFSTCNIARDYSLEVMAGFYCISGTPIDYVSVLSDIIVRSGISPNADQIGLGAPSGPPPSGDEPPYAPDDKNGPTQLPTYKDALAEGGPPVVAPARHRREFHQSDDYYQEPKGGDD